MAVQDRPLDLRKFQDIVDEARRLIPKYCPEWTDHNVSDPGITLIELFAWMTEMILYQVNRVPAEMYDRFLDLIGIQRRPPEPALADVTVYLASPQKRRVVIPAETEFSTERTDQTDAIVFATTSVLAINPPTLEAVRAWRTGQGFEDYLPYISSGLVEAPIFNDVPQEGDALYIGYRGNLWGYSLQLWIECSELEGAHIDPNDPPLEWEFYSGASQRWDRVRLLDERGTGLGRDPEAPDPTRGLNKNGHVYIHIPLDATPCVVDGIEATWIRLRYVARGDQRYTQSPKISRLRTEAIGATVPSRQAHLVQSEFLGSSDGTPDQPFGTRESPILRRDVPHVIDAKLDEDEAEWLEVDDFSQSNRDDRHFVINYAKGEIRFGPAIRARDGTERQYGAIPRKGALLKIRTYYSGGGAVGNVGEGTITQLNTTLPYVAAVMNYRPAAGGYDEESFEEAQLRSLSVLKRSATAITREDFERLAEAVEGVGRAHCLTADQDGSLPAGTVRLLIVPRLPPPSAELIAEDLMPSPYLIQSVSEYLDERRSLGTVVLYGPAQFTWVEIDAHLYARRGAQLPRLKEELALRLRAYLHPLDGRPGGRPWRFGGQLSAAQIAGLLQEHPDVLYAERIRLRLRGEQRDQSRIIAPPGGLLALAATNVDVDEAADDI
jgi:predicted phage baseplate assembly protein